MRPAERTKRIKPYLFARLDELKREATERGVRVIDFGKGDPDQPTPEHIVGRLKRAASNPRYHRYPPYAGLPELKEAAADYYRRRFGVELDPEREVLVLIGSKEGLTHLIWAYTNEGDPVLLPDPAYPVYEAQVLLIGGRPSTIPLLMENDFVPDLAAINPGEAQRAPLMIVNYPHNPTGAVVDQAFFRDAVGFAHKHDLVLCNDFAYAETTFDGYRAPSVLSVEGSKECAVESYSLSKPFNMTGWRIGFLVGNAGVIAEVGKLKSNMDSGQFGAIQEAAIEALTNDPQRVFDRANQVYARRRDMVLKTLAELQLEAADMKATFYTWLVVPDGHTSESFAMDLLEKEGILVAPGNGYGAAGEGYVRLALTLPDEDIDEGMKRLRRYFVR